MTFDGAFLRSLGERAEDWATAYVNIVEQLIRRGVPEGQARLEARLAASEALWLQEEPPEDRSWEG